MATARVRGRSSAIADIDRCLPYVGGAGHTRSVEQPGMALRVSDVDREVVVDALREHFFAGRLDVEEFTERVEQAYAARTAGELEAVERELPAAAGVGATGRKPWLLPGNTSFAVRIHSRRPPALAVDEVLGDVVTKLTGVGFVPEEERPTKRVFVRSERPTWTIVVAVLFFPLGLIALVHRARSQVVFSASP